MFAPAWRRKSTSEGAGTEAKVIVAESSRLNTNGRSPKRITSPLFRETGPARRPIVDPGAVLASQILRKLCGTGLADSRVTPGDARAIQEEAGVSCPPDDQLGRN